MAETRRTRSPINALKIINELRSQNSLPKIGAKPKTIKITSEIKQEVTKQSINLLFPDALIKADFVLTERQTKDLLKEVETRLEKIRSGKEPVPAITVKASPPKATAKTDAPKKTSPVKKAAPAKKSTDKPVVPVLKK